MAWHVGRTVGVTIYQGEAKDDLVGVMVGEHQRACELAALVVTAVNERDALLAERDDLRAAIPVLAIQVQHVRENLADGNVDGAGELLSELDEWVHRWQAAQDATPDA